MCVISLGMGVSIKQCFKLITAHFDEYRTAMEECEEMLSFIQDGAQAYTLCTYTCTVYTHIILCTYITNKHITHVYTCTL